MEEETKALRKKGRGKTKRIMNSNKLKNKYDIFP